MRERPVTIYLIKQTAFHNNSFKQKRFHNKRTLKTPIKTGFRTRNPADTEIFIRFRRRF